MTIKSTFTSAALAAGLLLPAVALSASAFAQTETPASGAQAQPAAPSAGAGPTMTHKKAATAKPVSRAERVEQHINRLHSQLQITPAQQAQWDQFAQVMRDNAKDIDQALDQRASGYASMNAAENLQSYAQIAQQHAQDTQKLATAFQSLYGSMPDAQKKNADTVFRAQASRHMQKHG